MKLGDIQADLDRPIIFRTVNRNVYEDTLRVGSIWLRSSHYYQQLEDQSRQDRQEGVNFTRTPFPLKFNQKCGQALTLKGNGAIGCEIIPHYIMSMHGTCISENVLEQFGGYTFGIRCLAKLSAEILYQASKQVVVHGYRYGQVAYQYSALAMSYHCDKSAICLSDDPPVYIGSLSTDVLRKEPVKPFIEQDEWRIAIFVSQYLGENPNEPLKINVDPSHFYEYINPSD